MNSNIMQAGGMRLPDFHVLHPGIETKQSFAFRRNLLMITKLSEQSSKEAREDLLARSSWNKFDFSSRLLYIVVSLNNKTS